MLYISMPYRYTCIPGTVARQTDAVGMGAKEKHNINDIIIFAI